VPGSVSAVVVVYGGSEAAWGCVQSLLGQSAPPDEVIVVDNHPLEEAADLLEHQAADVRVLRPGANLGYTRACELAARAASGEWLFFLNPDAEAEPTCLERLLDAADEGVGVLGAQVLMADGQMVNAGHNPVHLSGLCWSGGLSRPRETAAPRDVACVSGAALAIRSELFHRLGGHSPGLSMYHDDVDLCWRARLAGATVRYAPAAVVRHDYAFDKGLRKWFLLEHNRAWTVLANYGVPTLVSLAPLLLATELAIARQARREGWWPEKRRAWRRLAGELGELRRWRARVQAGRTVSDSAIIDAFTGVIDSPLLSGSLLDRANPWMERYRRLVLWLLRP